MWQTEKNVELVDGAGVFLRVSSIVKHSVHRFNLLNNPQIHPNTFLMAQSTPTPTLLGLN